MKRVFLIACAGLMLSVSAQAQIKKKTTASKVSVPENINSSFATSNAGVKGNWSKNYTGNYVASFTDSTNLKQSLEYNKKGDVVRTTTTYDVAAIPENITTALQGQYASAKVVDAVKVQVPGVPSFYRVKIEAADTKKQKQVLISEDGLVTE